MSVIIGNDCLPPSICSRVTVITCVHTVVDVVKPTGCVNNDVWQSPEFTVVSEII